MVTLLCFCCDHRNPVGAKFCNACGTPLHLKPCKHCEAINVRAAAHCHRCGETFALEFLSLDEAAQMQDAPVAAEVSPAVDAPGAAAFERPLRRGAFTTRVAAVLLGLTAMALLSAYYAYRHPGIGLDAAGLVQRSQTAASPGVPDLRREATPLHASAPAELGLPAAPAERVGISIGAAQTLIGAEVDGRLMLEAPSAPAASARPRSGAKRSASPTKTKPEPVRRATRPTRVAPVAISPPGAARHLEAWPEPDPGPIALQQTLAAPPVRSAAADPAPVQRSRDSGRRSTSPVGGWDRPCQEGVALDSSCDVRTMPKGN